MRRSPSSQSNSQKITLIALGVLVVGTVFFLPRFVSEPWIRGDTSEKQTPQTPSAETVAPSTAAELKRYRQDSQGVLAEIIVMRDRLIERNVEAWAAADFERALAGVQAGDEEYSFGNYETSLKLYRTARDQLEVIDALGDLRLSKAKEEGVAAVESLNMNVASDASELASAIAPDDPEVKALAARVKTLEAVAEHIEAGDYALERDRFDTAQSELRKALALDPAHQRAAELLSLANREVTGGAFRRQMSRGFAALERGAYDEARTAFDRAAEIDPANPAIGQALAQVENRESMERVSAELARGAELEADEKWAEALEIYEALLEEDSSLADARARLIPARVRADLDERMSEYIEEPLRVSNKSEFEKAQALLADAQSIGNPGPRLQGQITELETILQRATSAVNVVFRSDNQTHVVLYRVAELGQFEQTSMKLRPGRYVAAGTRKGYRDVRVEFTITGDPMDQPIVVRCEEPVG